MIRRPPRSTRSDTLFPSTTLFRSGRALDGGGFDATLSVPTLTGTLRGRTLDGKAEFTAQGETYRGTASLTLDSGHIDIEGDAGTAPRLHWDARATLDGFDPGFFVDGWTGAVDANIASKGGADRKSTRLNSSH